MEKIKQLGISKKTILAVAVAIAAAGVLAGGVYGLLYATTPAHIRHPAFEHYHFRAQIIVNGQDVDFSADKFQQHYDSGNCTIEVGDQPVDFHDNAKQMAHVHWDGMSGGEILKYFGWNLIGGGDGSLGWRYDGGPMRMHNVGIYGDVLPDLPDNANFYVYVGDENGYQQKDWDDFLNQNLEDFFGQQSNVKPAEQTGFDPAGWLLPKAYAHGGEEDEQQGMMDGGEKSQEELTRINNLIGNVVIFVQPEEPASEQVKAKFDNLVPLTSSTCGG